MNRHFRQRALPVWATFYPQMRFIRPWGVVALGVAIFLTLTAGQPLLAATIPVTTTADELNSDGDCSLREAISAANANAAVDACPAGSGADIVRLPAGTYHLTLTGANEEANATGDLDATDGAGLTLRGVRATNTIIDAAGLQDRVLHAVNGPLTVDRLTLQQGQVIDSAGGCLLAGGNLRLLHSRITHCATTTTNWDGWGSVGGGLMVGGNALITGTVILSNTGDGNGGGAFIGGDATIAGTTVLSNTASGCGGGIYVSGVATIAATTFQENRNDLRGSQDGGGLYVYGPSTVTASTFLSNTSSYYGGGAFLGGVAGFYPATLTDTIFQGNHALLAGGGVFVVGDPTVTRGAFVQNRAVEGVGGGLLASASIVLTGTTFLSNTSDGGGVIHLLGEAAEPMSVVNSLFAGNQSGQGAVILLEGRLPSSRLALLHNTIVHPDTYRGSAVAVVNGTLAMTNTLIAGYTVGVSNTNGLVTEDYNRYATGVTPTAGNVTSSGHSRVAPVAFIDTTTYTPTPASCTANVGTDVGVAVDFLGAPRPQQGAFDIGHVELAQALACDAEITVRGNGREIADGARMPTVADGRAFGPVEMGDQLMHTFTISNTGAADLTGLVVTLTGSSDFHITAQPATTVGPQGGTTFQITYAPTAPGMAAATVRIASNDSDENPTTFVINGQGMPPRATITIVLDAQPQLPTNLGFGGSLRGFILDDPTHDDGDAYRNSRTFTVAPGSYTIYRNNVNTWYTMNIACTPESNAAVNLTGRGVTLTVVDGDAVTCTFTEARSVRIRARVFNDLVRHNANLGRRNAGDPWLEGWTVSAFSALTTPTTTVASTVTTVIGDNIYEAQMINLRPGAYTLCTILPDASWTPTAPSVIHPVYGQPCSSIPLLAPGQSVYALFGAYQPTVATSADVTAADEAISDEAVVVDLPYDPAEDEMVTDDAALLRLFLPLIQR